MKIFVLFDCGDSLALFSLPDSVIVKNGNPVYIPDFDTSFCARCYVAVRICRLGKSIAPRFAYRYFEEVAPAMCISAENLLNKLRTSGLPWTEAVAFDKCCVLGSFTNHKDTSGWTLYSSGNSSETRLQLPNSEKIHNAIADISIRHSLKMGDLILLPLFPAESFPLIPDSLMEIKAGNEVLLRLPVK